MGKGRSSKKTRSGSNWHYYFQKNIGEYFKIIILELSKANQIGKENGADIIQSIANIKGNELNKIKVEDIPFKVPKNWAWCKLPFICEISTGNKDVNEGHSEGIYTFFTCAKEPLKSNTYTFDDDCILLPGNGANVGHVNRFNGKFELYQRTYCLHKINKLISIDYLEFYLKSFWKRNLGKQYGSGINYLRISNFLNFLIPIPPVSEQKQIVEFLQALEANKLKTSGCFFNIEIENKIISLHKSQLLADEISHELSFQLSQIEILNQAILQEAVQGKLVAQNPEDEPASELLMRIKAEKAKTGKKEKPLPPIKPEEIPFEIPKNWVWCKLGELSSLITSGSRNWNKYYSKSGALFIRSQNIKSTSLDLTNKIFVQLPKSTEGKRTSVQKQDILITITGAGVTNCALLPDLIFEESYVSQHISLVRMLKTELSTWVHRAINSANVGKKQFSEMIYGDKPGLNLQQISNLLIPIPPLSEQKRIVAEIEKQLAKTKQLKEHIIANQQATEQLLKALLHQAFEVEVKVEVEELELV